MKWRDMSPYFTPREILSPECLAHPHLVCKYALIRLNELRENWGNPLFVNYAGMSMRGVISSNENRVRVSQYGGANLTTHVQGHAFDVSPKIINKANLSLLAKIAKDVGFSWVVIYRSWIHIDCRTIIEL